MKIHVCTKCKKPKKKKIAPGETRIAGAEVYEDLLQWVEDHPELLQDLSVKSKKCLDKCKKGPNVYIKPTRTFRHRLTKERLARLKEELVEMLEEKAG